MRELTPELSVRLNTGTYRLAGTDFTCPDFSAELRGEKLRGTPFRHYALRLVFSRPVQLLRISWRVDRSFWKKTFLYQTFFNASAAVFQRNGKRGHCFGFANPFCRLEGNELYFEPAIRYDRGEEYRCDDIFTGTYPLTGKMIAPEFGVNDLEINGRCHPRYRNPGEGIPLDAGEINAFNRYTAWYCEGVRGEFKFTSYNFFSNLPQRPDTPESIAAYKAHLDNCRKLGVDTVILNPLCHNEIPHADPASCWEFFPEGSRAEELFCHARNCGLKVGIYTGTAGTQARGNCPVIPFADVPAWKKLDFSGKISTENCIGSDDFLQWYIQVQTNTIQKYRLDLWNWDPGPGNAFFCFNPAHRHLPGRGAYLGFRNALKVMKELRARFPGLYYQSFHGLKEYGVWGFKYVNQHEAYWENDIYWKMPVFPDGSADRFTADGIRQQSAWDILFRFLPASLNHGLAHRMLQGCGMGLPNTDRMFDLNGWKYALLSAVASGGAVTLPILPHDVEQCREYRSFYRKWVGFARKNFRLSAYTIPFGAFPGCGVDGFAKIVRNRGYLFFFNGSPRPESLRLKLDETLGFTPGKTVFLSQIYPYPMPAVRAETGKTRRFVLPAYGVRIFKVLLRKPETRHVRLMPPLPRTLPLQCSVPGHAASAFFASGAIRSLLNQASAEMDAEVREAANAMRQKYQRENFCWTFPDRLWLWISFDTLHPGLTRLRINGKDVPFSREKHKSLVMTADGIYFADVTDFIRWDAENTVDAEFTADSGRPVLYLHYPKPDREAIPADTALLAMNRALPRTPLCRTAPRLSGKVKIVSAALNKDNVMLPDTENELTAACNLPPEELEGVFASVPISIWTKDDHLKNDMALEWKDGAWRCRFRSGVRIDLIVDDEKIVLWAVTRRNTESAGYILPIQWKH